MDSYFRWYGLPGSVVLTALLSALALILALCNPTPVRWVCFAAMALSSVGDLFLARFGGLDRIFPNYFVIGAGFFMAAHILYILCYGMKIHGSGALFWNGGAIAAIAIGVIIAFLLCRLAMSTGNMSVLLLILVYALIIVGNCMTVFSYAWSTHSFFSFLAVVGVISFFASDLVIGLGIAGDIHQYDFLIWWLYPVGQVLLIFGAAFS